ncbi:hypothetical protein HUJ05_003135 [Dendroctonus ponderosae]|nr:hypothetical protein HUJ05_009488 [Dendroctonus ponderosae]KAH1029995.1 hypothetical protein HUJ05_003135 [Dendroctonus ponderosae]
MTDVPHHTFHSLEKNVLETPSASPSYDFLLKKLPPFWLERDWRVSNLLLMKVAADLQKQTVVGPIKLSGLLEFILPLIFSTPYRQRQHSRRNNHFRSIATGENLAPKKIYPTKQSLLSALEASNKPRYHTRRKSENDDKWPYDEFRFDSPPSATLPSAVCSPNEIPIIRKKPLSVNIDIQSISLSPPGSRTDALYLRGCPSLSSSKDVSLLDLDDIKKLRYIENRESQEDEAEYEAGGYMPINTGDVLKNQYKETRTVNPNHVGYKNIVQMVDTFKLISENGVHNAISLEIMGPSLLHLLMQSDFRGIQVAAVRRIIFQVLRGLTYLHEECHIIHTDIKPENILIKVDENYIKKLIGQMERFSEMGVDLPRSYVSSEFWTKQESSLHDSEEDIIPRFGEHRASSYPGNMYFSEMTNYRERHSQTDFSTPMWVSPNIEIKIADLGNACWVDHHFSPEIQTRQYRALEVILGAGYSYPADLWSIGCLAFELATGEMLFSPKGSSEHSANIDHLCLIWETLGGIPKYITETGTEFKKYFANGHLKDVPADNLRIWKIEDVLVEKYKWKRLDAIPFASFLSSLVEPDPALRATSSQALNNEWLLSTDI